MNEKSDFAKQHGSKVILAVIMIIVNLIGFVYIFSEKDKLGYVHPYSPEVSFAAQMIASFIMFIPPVVLIIYAVRHRKDKFVGYGSDVANSVVSAVVIIVFSALYVVAWFIIHAVATFLVPMLFPKVI